MSVCDDGIFFYGPGHKKSAASFTALFSPKKIVIGKVA
jgi:hypothetical protein